MWYKIFYLFSILDRVGGSMGLLAIIGIVCVIITGIVGVIYADTLSEYKDNTHIWRMWRRFLFSFIGATFFFFMIWTLLPRKSDMLLIIAGGAVGEFVSNNKEARELPADVTKFLHEEIKKATKSVVEEAPQIVKDGTEAVKTTANNVTKEELMKIISDQQEILSKLKADSLLVK